MKRGLGWCVAAAFAATLSTPAGTQPSTAAPPAIRFVDATAESRLTSGTPADDPLKGAYVHAAAWGDVNGDGAPDLYVGTFTDSPSSYYQFRGADGPAPNRLFLNNGDGTFSLAPNQAATSIRGRTAGAVFADLDGDGRLDLVVSGNSYPPGQTSDARKNEQARVFRNTGAQLVDVTAGSGLPPGGFAGGRAVGVLDYDGDGCLDLYLVSDPFHQNTGPSRLLRGDCAFHFVDVTATAGLDRAQGDTVQGLGVGVGDLDGDGWPDLFVAGGPRGRERRNFLFLNQRDGTFREVSNGTVFDEPPCSAGSAEDWTSGVALADLNHDGRLDIVLSHHFGSASSACAIGPTLYVNTAGASGAPEFTNVTAGSGVQGIPSKAPHSEVVDLDDDGCPDIITSVRAATPDGDAPLVYRCVQSTAQPLFETPRYDASSLRYYAGAAVADYNRDGRPDIFMEEFDPRHAPVLYKNTSAAGHWLDVRVSAPRNPFGLGAKVLVYARGQAGNASALLAMTQIQSGNGFSSAGEPSAHIGLGTATAVEVVVVLPFGQGTRARSVTAVDRRISM